MAQGNIKVKSKLPAGTKSKKKPKGKSMTQRPNAPAKTKKNKSAEKSKIKATVMKMVNAAAEKQLRALTTTTPQLTEAQKRAAAAPTAPTTSK